MRAHKPDVYTATFLGNCVYLGGLAFKRAHVYYVHKTLIELFAMPGSDSKLKKKQTQNNQGLSYTNWSVTGGA